jgi:Leucine-rich repeat (LRR) protein
VISHTTICNAAFFGFASGDTLTLFCSRCLSYHIEGNGLDGYIPREITHLTTLSKLHFGSNNAVAGPIPSDLDKLSRLEYFALSRNRMTGNLPTSLCQLDRLRKLYLGFNYFDGAIPSCIDNLTNLETLFVSEIDIVSSKSPSVNFLLTQSSPFCGM